MNDNRDSYIHFARLRHNLKQLPKKDVLDKLSTTIEAKVVFSAKQFFENKAITGTMSDNQV